jgi:hypothetical protein
MYVSNTCMYVRTYTVFELVCSYVLFCNEFFLLKSAVPWFFSVGGDHVFKLIRLRRIGFFTERTAAKYTTGLGTGSECGRQQ